MPIEDMVIKNGDWKNYEQIYLNSIERTKEFRKENPEIVASFDAKYVNRVFNCPDCGQVMKNVGLDFRAPKKEKKEEWKILKSLYSTGKFFLTCGCSAYGFIPKDVNQYERYLVETKESFQQRALLREDNQSMDKLDEYLAYWNLKIAEVDSELRKLNKQIDQ